MILFGPGDFSQGIGAPGDMDNPTILKTRELVAATARKHGKHAGTIGGPPSFQRFVDMGYNFISIGADVIGLGNYFQSLLSEVRDAAAVGRPGGVYAQEGD